MWTIECYNDDAKTEITKVKARGKIDAAIKYQSLLHEWDNVAVYDEDGEYIDPTEL